MEPVEESGVDVLRAEVRHVKESIGEMRDTLRSINAAVQALVRLEQAQMSHGEALARAFKTLEDHEERLSTLENERGVLNLVKSWVITGVVGIIGLVALALARLFR